MGANWQWGGWPNCCLECEVCTGQPSEWVADFGAGGWTNNAGTNCTEFAGEITLGPGVATPSPCESDYCWDALADACCIWTGPIEQDGTCSGDCGDERGCETYGPNLIIWKTGSSPTTWRYNLEIWIGCGTEGAGSRVGYRSTESSDGDCLWEADAETGKITLDRFTNYHTPGLGRDPPGCAPCTGTMPATIDIWPA
jgi:hypothetical protein